MKGDTVLTVANPHGMAVGDRLALFTPRPWWRRLWAWLRAKCGRPEPAVPYFIVREVISNTKLIVQRAEDCQ